MLFPYSWILKYHVSKFFNCIHKWVVCLGKMQWRSSHYLQERVENNRQKLESHLSELVQKTSERDNENNGSGNMLLSRMENPPNRFSGYARGYGEKDYITSHEVIFSPSTKLPYVEKLPPYTTWIFLDRYVSLVSIFSWDLRLCSKYWVWETNS